MNIDEYPSLLHSEIEIPICENYRNALKIIRESDDPIECLEQLTSVFEDLKGSIPSPGKSLEWARDLIHTYRNLGKIFGQVINLGEFESEQTSKIEEIIDKHKRLLDEYDGGNYPEKMDNVLNYLGDIEEVLKDYEIRNADDLREKLDEKSEDDRINEFERYF